MTYQCGPPTIIGPVLLFWPCCYCWACSIFIVEILTIIECQLWFVYMTVLVYWYLWTQTNPPLEYIVWHIHVHANHFVKLCTLKYYGVSYELFRLDYVLVLFITIYGSILANFVVC